MARAIKQSVDGSGYPSSSTLFPITREEEEEGRPGGQTGRRYLCDADPSGRFTFLAPSSLHECIAARKREEMSEGGGGGGGGRARWNYNPQGAPQTGQ